MVRKTTWSLLLLLLVSVQALASVCDVRCETMALMGSANPMVGIDHCQGMASQAETVDAAVYTVRLPQPCAGDICKTDWSLLSRAVYEFGPLSLPVTVMRAAAGPVPIEASRRWKTDRSTHDIPTFDPILSRLRV